MANYYTHFCFQFPETTPDAELEKLDWLLNLDYDDPQYADVALTLFGDEEYSPYFDVELDEDNTLTDASGYAEITPIARAIQMACPSVLPFGFTWADTCDKRRVEAFSGGWVAIFADRIEIEYASTALQAALEE